MSLLSYVGQPEAVGPCVVGPHETCDTKSRR